MLLLNKVAAAATGFVFKQYQPGTNTGGSAVWSWSVTVTGTVAGSLLVIILSWYPTGPNTASSMTSDNGTTISPVPNCFQYDGYNCIDMWYGINAASGSITITGNFPTQDVYCQMQCVEFSGNAPSSVEEGIGNHLHATGYGPDSISTNGGTTQAGSLIVSAASPHNYAPTSVGTDQIFISAGYISYQLANVGLGQTITHTYGGYAGSNDAATYTIAAFKHA